ncbi:MAG: transposase [Terrimicrobiaceae bacterium]|nr:transposase [Terrimicrobiaceae bacterium]
MVITRFLRLISQQICAEPLMLRCMKLLGIGKTNAFALLAVTGEVRRFDRPEKLVAYIGLNPGQRRSGNGKNIKLGVGKRGRGDMRHLLIQGAQAVLRMGGNTPLGKWGWNLFARKGNRNTAVAAVARKLLVQVWHLLSGNPPAPCATAATSRLLLSAPILGGEIRRSEFHSFPVAFGVFLLCLSFLGGSAQAEARLAPLFTDHAVGKKNLVPNAAIHYPEGMRKLCVVGLVPGLLAMALCGEVLDAKSAAGKMGEKVLFEDTIREVVRGSGTVFLNFGAAYPGEIFAVVVMKDIRSRFPGIETWNGKKVRVEGMASDYEGHRRIILRERGQIAFAE